MQRILVILLCSVAFQANPIDRKAERKLLSFRTGADDFRVHGREIYWLCRIRSSESEFSLERLEKELGIQPTFRNSNTVREIADKHGAVVGEKLGSDVIAGTTDQRAPAISQPASQAKSSKMIPFLQKAGLL